MLTVGTATIEGNGSKTPRPRGPERRDGVESQGPSRPHRASKRAVAGSVVARSSTCGVEWWRRLARTGRPACPGSRVLYIPSFATGEERYRVVKLPPCPRVARHRPCEGWTWSRTAEVMGLRNFRPLRQKLLRQWSLTCSSNVLPARPHETRERSGSTFLFQSFDAFTSLVRSMKAPRSACLADVRSRS
jgi:hypothetical protein